MDYEISTNESFKWMGVKKPLHGVGASPWKFSI